MGRFSDLLAGYKFHLLDELSRISAFCVGIFLFHFLLLYELGFCLMSKLGLHVPLLGFAISTFNICLEPVVSPFPPIGVFFVYLISRNSYFLSIIAIGDYLTHISGLLI